MTETEIRIGLRAKPYWERVDHEVLDRIVRAVIASVDPKGYLAAAGWSAHRIDNAARLIDEIVLAILGERS